MRWLIGIAVVAACGGGDARILFTIHGDVGTVATLELIAAEPLAVEKLQRSNDPAAATNDPERVYYVAQRTHTSIAIGGSVDGFQLQVALGDDAPYLPIAIARDGGGQAIGMGVLSPGLVFPPLGNVDPPKLWATDSVQYQADVTAYDLDLQPVTQLAASDAPTPVRIGDVLDVGCDGAMSGLVWRVDEARLDRRGRELRVLLPLGGELDARSRLEHGADMDCDSHTATARIASRASRPASSAAAGRRGSIEDGDKLDCDDTSATTFAGAEEVCDGFDDDCDGLRSAVIAAQDDPACAQACIGTSACSDLGPDAKPVCAAACLACGVPQQLDAANAGELACRAEAQLKPPGCDLGCVMTLIDVDPRWDVRIGPRANPDHGVSDPFVVTSADDIAVVTDSSTLWSPADTSGGAFLVFVQPSGQPGYLVAFDLDISVTGGGLTMCDGGTKSMTCQ